MDLDPSVVVSLTRTRIPRMNESTKLRTSSYLIRSFVVLYFHIYSDAKKYEQNYESKKGTGMSLAIDPTAIIAVLLHDGWHPVESFEVDAFEVIDHPDEERPHDFLMLHSAGQGFRFEDDQGRVLAAPMTSILAVRTRS